MGGVLGEDEQGDRDEFSINPSCYLEGELKTPWSSVTVTGLQTKTENGELHGHQHCTRILLV